MHPQRNHSKKIKAMDKEMVTFAPVHPLVDEVKSEMTPRDLQIKNHTHGESVTTAQLSIDSGDKINASANKQLWAPPPNGLCALRIKWYDGPYDIGSLFRTKTYRIGISVSIFVNRNARRAEHSRTTAQTL